MEVLTPIETKPSIPEKSPKPSPNFGRFLLLAAFFVILFSTFDDFVVQTPDGSYDLRPERKSNLERRTKELDEAEQYVLLATKDGWYDCYNCGTATKIYLYRGEVWKYGVSIHGSKRYKKWWYLKYNLEYEKQFEGDITTCRKMELKKIYSYPLLPENLKRDYRLPRPPGNKEDY